MTVKLRRFGGPPLRFLKILVRPLLAGLNRVMATFLPKRHCPAPIFIIGAPRTGSTILYQALSNALDTLYIDNLTSRFYFNLFLGFWLSERRYNGRPHGNFEARHGNTTVFGGHAPSECGSFWYQWLPKENHFVDHGEVKPRHVAQIRFAICFPSRWFMRPILFKNLNAGQRLRLIHEAFPDAKIIFIRRDVEDTVASIMKARKDIGVPADRVWSVRPRNYRQLERLPEEEMCRQQVQWLERQIEEDLALFAPEQVCELHFDELSAQLIERLRRWIGVDYREGYSLPQFRTDRARQT